MNEIREWSFEGASIRTVEIDGEPWFIGKDVAERLGYTNSRRAIAAHVDEDDKGVTKCYTPGGAQQLTVINESGVYALIFGSKLPDAKRFKHWVTSEVLPAIRKTGKYSLPTTPERKPDSYMIDNPVERAQRWIEETTEWQNKMLTMQTQLDKQAPKVALADAIIGTDDGILIGEFAKILRQSGIDTGQRRLFQWLRDNEWLCSTGSRRNLPTQEAIAKGYMIIQERTLHFNGQEVVKFTPLITGAGQQFFFNWFMTLGNPQRKPREIAADRLHKAVLPQRALTTDRKRVGANIRRELERRSMTQQALADAIGATRQDINHTIHGTRTISTERIAKIAEVLGVTTDDLMRG